MEMHPMMRDMYLGGGDQRRLLSVQFQTVSGCATAPIGTELWVPPAGVRDLTAARRTLDNGQRLLA